MLFLLPAVSLFAQETASLAYYQLRLKELLEDLRNATDDSSRLEASDLFEAAFAAQLAKKEAFTFAFDSLKGITASGSPDKKFRVFTWPVRLGTGGYRLYGILQIPDKKSGSNRVIRLIDLGDTMSAPEKAILDTSSWFGAVYYQVIPVRGADGMVFYTLLGWRGLSTLVSSRVADVLTLGPRGDISFGRQVFCDKAPLPVKRLIFRYSANASMVLTYEKQSLVTARKWNAKTREFETEKIREMMIVCDRVLPMDPQMEGRYEYYLPASDVMDGYIFREGCWTLVRDVDARNPEHKSGPLPRDPGK